MNPYYKLNFFTWSMEDNYCSSLEGQYSGDTESWINPFHSMKLRVQAFKEKINTEETCSKYSGFVKFDEITIKLNPKITIKYYKDQYCDHTIRVGIYYPYQNIETKGRSDKILLISPVFLCIT